jgi:hypothetical protein
MVVGGVGLRLWGYMGNMDRALGGCVYQELPGRLQHPRKVIGARCCIAGYAACGDSCRIGTA